MENKRSKDTVHQRGLRISKPHAEELVNFYNAHVQSEAFHAGDLLRINYAHVLMLYEQKVLPRQEAHHILKSLHHLEKEGVGKAIAVDPRIGDLSTHMEAYVIGKTGEETGGKIHTGRSRNDLYTTLTKMFLRQSLLDIYDTLLTLEGSLLLLTFEHIETVMPGYTHHSQPAQPITFGHYILGNFDVFSRDLKRIEDFWPRLNTCPMGAAAMATTGFPLNRQRIAELLGFNGIHEHSYDAVSAKDFLLEYLFILAIISSDLGRLAENLLYWNTAVYGMISLADEYTSFSTIMPQKKNPVAVETLRAFNSIISGKLFNAFGILKAEPWSNGREMIILDDDSLDTGKQVQNMILLLNGMLKTMEVRKDRMRELSGQGFSTATELADTLSREYHFSFRTAHEVVGLLVKRAVESGIEAGQILPEMVEECIQQCLGKNFSVNPEIVRKALDPRENVRIRSLPGGPAFEEVTRMAKNREKILSGMKAFLSDRRSRLAEAYQDLNKKVEEMIQYKPPSTGQGFQV